MPDSDEIKESTKRDIRWQVVSEEMHRDDLNRLKDFKEWLELVGVNPETRKIMFDWIEDLINEQLKMRMQMKKFMKNGIKNALEIRRLRSV